MNWSLFLLNQLLEDAFSTQTRRPFSYSCILILIALVEEVKDFGGARYQNLWWVKEPIHQTDYATHFWIYWEALQESTITILIFSPHATAKYEWILRFAIGPHSIHF